MTTKLKTPNHVIADPCYAEERFTCSCGVIVRGEPDVFSPGRHLPLIEAWAAHRKATRSRVGMVQDGHGRWIRRPAA